MPSGQMRPRGVDDRLVTLGGVGPLDRNCSRPESRWLASRTSLTICASRSRLGGDRRRGARPRIVRLELEVVAPQRDRGAVDRRERRRSSCETVATKSERICSSRRSSLTSRNAYTVPRRIRTPETDSHSSRPSISIGTVWRAAVHRRARRRSGRCRAACRATDGRRPRRPLDARHLPRPRRSTPARARRGRAARRRRDRLEGTRRPRAMLDFPRRAATSRRRRPPAARAPLPARRSTSA